MGEGRRSRGPTPPRLPPGAAATRLRPPTFSCTRPVPPPLAAIPTASGSQRRAAPPSRTPLAACRPSLGHWLPWTPDSHAFLWGFPIGPVSRGPMGVVVLPPPWASAALPLPERRAGFGSRAPFSLPAGGAAPGICLRRGFWGSKQCSPLQLRRGDGGASRNANLGLVAGDEFRPEDGKAFQKQPLAGRERSRLSFDSCSVIFCRLCPASGLGATGAAFPLPEGTCFSNPRTNFTR